MTSQQQLINEVGGAAAHLFSVDDVNDSQLELLHSLDQHEVVTDDRLCY